MERRRWILPLAAVLTVQACDRPAPPASDLLAEGRFPGCEISFVEVGEHEAGWTLLGGFEPAVIDGVEVGRLRGEGSLLLVLDRPGRWLDVRAAGRRGTKLAAVLDGVDLGPRPLRRRYRTLSWRLPDDAVRPGPAHLVLRLDRPGPGPRRPQRLAASVYAVSVRPAARCGDEAASVAPRGFAGPRLLPAGRVAVAPPFPHPEPALTLRFSAGARDALVVQCASPRGLRRAATLRAARGGRVAQRLEGEAVCGADERTVLWSRTRSGLELRVARLEASTAGDWLAPARRRGAAAPLAALAILVLLAAAGVRPPTWRREPWIDTAIVVLVALAARAAFLLAYPHPGESADSFEYLLRAGFLASGQAEFWSEASWHAWQSFLRAPGYFLFLAAAGAPSTAGQMAVVMLQGVFSALAAGLVYWIARPLFGRGAALVSGLIFALWIESIVTFSRLLSEPLFLLLLLAALAAVSRLAVRPSGRTAAAAGLLLGLAALVRPGPVIYGALLAVLLPWILGRRRGLATAAVLVGCLALVVGPWCVRNSWVRGQPTGIDTTWVFNLLLDAPQPDVVDASDLDLSDPQDKKAYWLRLNQRNAGGAIEGRSGHILWRALADRLARPGPALRQVAGRLKVFFGPLPDVYLRGILAEHDRVRVAALTASINLQLLLLLPLGLAGLVWRLGERRAWPLALWLLLATAVLNVLTFPLPRLRLLVLPALMVFAGAAMAAVLERLRRASPLRRRMPRRATVLLLLAVAGASAAAAAETSPAAPDAGPGGGLRLFPPGHLFRLPVADPHRPGAAIAVESYVGTEIEGASDRRFFLRLGGRFGLLGWRPADPSGRSWQLGLEAGLDGQFDIDLGQDNIGWDGNYGLSLTTARGGGRRAYLIGILHTSAHLGDEWIARTGRERINYTREEVRAAASSRLAARWRAYVEAGYGYTLRAEELMEPLRAQLGLEVDDPRSLWNGRAGWYAAADLQAWEERAWRLDVTLQAGLRFDPAGRVWRLGLEMRDGRVPLGELFRETETVWTVGLWSEL